MKLYLCMVLGGSICTLLYIIFNHLFPYEFSLKNKNLFLKITIMFYLLPVPWAAAEIKAALKTALKKAGIEFPAAAFSNIMYPDHMWESMIIRSENGKMIYITGYQKWISLVFAVSVLFLVLALWWIITYMLAEHYYKKDIIYVDPDRYLKDIDTGRRKIQIGISSRIASPATIGIVKPLILLPVDDAEYAVSIKGIIRHEVNHVLGMDILFRFFIFLAVITEWYNPLAYYLFREYTVVREMLCDEAAVKGMTKKEKLDYMECLIAAVNQKNNLGTTIMTLGAKNNLTKERMIRIMGKNEKKAWKKSLAAGIMAGCFLLSGFPALAYEEPLRVIETGSVDNIREEWDKVDIGTFFPTGETLSCYKENFDYSLGDYVFIDEAGEVYFCEDCELYGSGQERIICSYSYAVGVYSKHESSSDGSCKVTYFSALRCTECGEVKRGSIITTETFDVCPH